MQPWLSGITPVIYILLNKNNKLAITWRNMLCISNCCFEKLSFSFISWSDFKCRFRKLMGLQPGADIPVCLLCVDITCHDAIFIELWDANRGVVGWERRSHNFLHSITLKRVLRPMPFAGPKTLAQHSCTRKTRTKTSYHNALSI